MVFCDYCFTTLYGYGSAEEMKGLDIRELIPSIDIDSENNCGDLFPKVSLFYICKCSIPFISFLDITLLSEKP